MKVGGRDFSLTKQEVEARMNGTQPETIQKHMVEVNSQWFPPKQVLGHVTGWARASFTTVEAQRVLARLGFACREARGPHLRQASEFVMEAIGTSVRQTVADHEYVEHQRGFTSATGIALRLIQDKLDGFKEQMKGPGLGQTEQAVYAHLDELKSDIEADYDRYWRGNGVNWRPLKPVAKAVIRRAEPEV